MTPTTHKPRICIAMPGIHYLHHVPYVLSTAPLISHLQKDYEVTLAFRKLLEEPKLGCECLSILDENQMSDGERRNQNSYYFPTNPIRTWRYFRQIDRFVQKNADRFDVVIERPWHFVGVFASAYQRRGVPALMTSEAEFYTTHSRQTLGQQIWNETLKRVLPILRRHWINQSSGVLVETRQMSDFMVRYGYMNHEKSVWVASVGVEPDIFQVRDRPTVRAQLGIPQDERMLLYVGSLNRFIQEPAPIIQALGQECPPGVKLHLVGDGDKRSELEAIAQQFNAPVVFHGRMSQEKASLYSAAADLCVAPYDKTRFPAQQFTPASLKISEYLACGRMVLTIPCDRMNEMLESGKYGFLVENKVEAYRAFFKAFPSPEELAHREKVLLHDLMNNQLREKSIVLTWGDAAEQLKQAIESVRRSTMEFNHSALTVSSMNPS